MPSAQQRRDGRASGGRGGSRPGRGNDTPYDRDTLYTICRRYYEDGADQTKIAREFGVSRATVSRMLSYAREIEMVEITVHKPKREFSSTLDRELAEALNLDRVYLAEGSNPPTMGPGMRPAVQQAVLDMGLHAGDPVVISSGMATFGIAQMELEGLHDTLLVPAVGGVAEPQAWHQTNEIVRQLAARSQASYLGIFAEAVSSPAVFEALGADPSFQMVQMAWHNARGALLGVGSRTISRTSISSLIPKNALPEAVGDVCLHFYNAKGELLSFPGAERTVHISREVLSNIPHATAVAVGAEKIESIVTSARMGLYRRLVTDQATAQLVLDTLAG